MKHLKRFLLGFSVIAMMILLATGFAGLMMYFSVSFELFLIVVATLLLLLLCYIIGVHISGFTK